MDTPVKILVLCTGNSCRSIMAEAALNHFGEGRIQAKSAGSKPTGKVHPKSLSLLASRGIPAEGFHSKTWDAFGDETFDAVITVCDQAAGESCPVFLGAPIKAHWGVPDPAHATGTDEEITAAFEKSYGHLEFRIKELLRLPLEKLNKQEFAAHMKSIGQSPSPKAPAP